MANKERYLNLIGLGRLWNNIKSKFYTKSEVDDLLDGLYCYVPTGDANSIETLKLLDGGTATTVDTLKVNGKDSSI